MQTLESTRFVLTRITSRRGANLSPQNSFRDAHNEQYHDSDDVDEAVGRKRQEKFISLVQKRHPPLQDLIRKRASLHRKNLIDRLVFEEDLRIGFLRLLRHILLFIFIMQTLNISKNVRVMRGIYIDLDNSFDLDNLRTISSRDDFISNWIPALSKSSKKYFIRSSRYFDTGGAGSVQLHAGTVLFSEPKSLGGLSISVHLDTFSFTAWLQVAPEFVEGYIFRKRMQPASKMICWGNFFLMRFNIAQKVYLHAC